MILLVWWGIVLLLLGSMIGMMRIRQHQAVDTARRVRWQPRAEVPDDRLASPH